MLERKELLKNLAIGFLPLLIFIVADALFGLTIGLIVAIGLSVIELAYIYYREKRIERFVLFDIGLIVALGLVSLILQNDIFFKLKPALIEGILLVLTGITAFSSSPVLLMMMGRYTRSMEISDEQYTEMRRMMRSMFYLLAVHIVLVVYSVFYMSNEAWGFISGGLFYIALGVLMLYEIWQVRRKRKALKEEEWFDIVTPEGRIVGRAPRSQVHGNPELLHPVVHVHIMNSNGDIFLQKRAQTKDLLPGYWDTAVGGHVHSGEAIEAALHREAMEELGIKEGPFQPIFRYVNKTEIESELVHAYLLRSNGPFFINREELEDGRFWKVAEIESALGTGELTPNFEHEFSLLKQHVLIQPSRRERRRRKR